MNGKIYTSILQCSKDTGIPKQVLKKAKALGGASNGFTQSGRITWDIAGPWIEANRTLLEANEDDDIQHYKKEIAKRDVVLRDLEIAKKKGEMVDPVVVKKFLQEFGQVLSASIKQKREELLSKVTGYESIIDKEFIELFSVITKQIESWK